VIGVFDSGVGGLSVWREMMRLMPDQPMLYLADQAHVPYGARALADVRALTVNNVAWLLERGCEMVVIACNTASAAALHHVRQVFPATPFVGMEPAVKPAASHTHTGVIGVLATQATFHGELFASVVMRFAAHVQVLEQPCPGWVEMVEQQQNDQALVDRYVLPLLDAGADVLVLGCTHFPFLEAAILASIERWRAIHAPMYEIALLDPSLAVAKQALRVRDQRGLTQSHNGASLRQYYTTGDTAQFIAVASRLLADDAIQLSQHAAQERAPALWSADRS
jgi:glutamate racemase